MPAGVEVPPGGLWRRAAGNVEFRRRRTPAGVEVPTSGCCGGPAAQATAAVVGCGPRPRASDASLLPSLLTGPEGLPRRSHPLAQNRGLRQPLGEPRPRPHCDCGAFRSFGAMATALPSATLRTFPRPSPLCPLASTLARLRRLRLFHVRMAEEALIGELATAWLRHELARGDGKRVIVLESATVTEGAPLRGSEVLAWQRAGDHLAARGLGRHLREMGGRTAPARLG